MGLTPNPNASPFERGKRFTQYSHLRGVRLYIGGSRLGVFVEVRRGLCQLESEIWEPRYCSTLLTQTCGEGPVKGIVQVKTVVKPHYRGWVLWAKERKDSEHHFALTPLYISAQAFVLIHGWNAQPRVPDAVTELTAPRSNVVTYIQEELRGRNT